MPKKSYTFPAMKTEIPYAEESDIEIQKPRSQRHVLYTIAGYSQTQQLQEQLELAMKKISEYKADVARDEEVRLYKAFADIRYVERVYAEDYIKELLSFISSLGQEPPERKNPTEKIGDVDISSSDTRESKISVLCRELKYSLALKETECQEKDKRLSELQSQITEVQAENLRLNTQLLLSIREEKKGKVELKQTKKLIEESDSEKILHTEPEELPIETDPIEQYGGIIDLSQRQRWTRGTDIVVKSLIRVVSLDEKSKVPYSELVSRVTGGCEVFYDSVSKNAVYKNLKHLLLTRDGDFVLGIYFS